MDSAKKLEMNIGDFVDRLYSDGYILTRDVVDSEDEYTAFSEELRVKITKAIQNVGIRKR